MEIYVAKVLNGKAVAKEYGVDKNASYVAAPSGKLFRGFTQNILEVVSFGGIRFFTLEADLKGVIVVPEDILRGAIDGDETLSAVQKKLTAHINPKPPAKGSDDKNDGAPGDKNTGSTPQK